MAERQLSGLRTQLSFLEKQSGPNSRGNNLQLPAGNVPEAGLQYVRKLRDVKYAETIFDLMAKQYEAARLDEEKTAAVIQVLDPAIEPDRKSSPHRVWIVTLVTLLGAFGSVLYVFLTEAFARMRLNADVDSRWTILKQSVFLPPI